MFIAIGVFVIILSCFIVAIMLRRVVPTNEVQIVQSGKATISYGKDLPAGNTYYEWPRWIPVLGVIKTTLPVSVFNLTLNGYEAYDKGRLPFVVDVVAFFRVSDSNLAAQRVSNFNELEGQLTLVVRGAIRTVLASHEIDEIMVERSKFGIQFTDLVSEQLGSWGVIAVKSIELMDIRDANGNQVIHNIMEKKKSLIEMQSRSEVAENMKIAQIAEINAQRDTETQKQVAMQMIGLQTATKDKEIGIAQQESQQAIKEQQKITQTKEMAIIKVNQVTQAEIDKEISIIQADQQKQTSILISDGNLESEKRHAEGVAIQGKAKAEAEKAMQLAPIQAQIELAKEIGSNGEYQKYLITIRQVEATQAVGMEQAKALEKADIKIIANTGEPVSGVSKVMDLFSAKGGTNLGAMLEGLAQSEIGKDLLEKVKSVK